jgi:hypothetical protein
MENKRSGGKQWSDAERKQLVDWIVKNGFEDYDKLCVLLDNRTVDSVRGKVIRDWFHYIKPALASNGMLRISSQFT